MRHIIKSDDSWIKTGLGCDKSKEPSKGRKRTFDPSMDLKSEKDDNETHKKQKFGPDGSKKREPGHGMDDFGSKRVKNSRIRWENGVFMDLVGHFEKGENKATHVQPTRREKIGLEALETDGNPMGILENQSTSSDNGQRIKEKTIFGPMTSQF